MVSRAELLAQAERRYGDFLRSIVTGETLFPLELRIGKSRRAPDYTNYQAELAVLRQAAADLGIHMEWEIVRAPRFGLHERPTRACFLEEEAYLASIDRTTEVRAFREDTATIRTAGPGIEPWLAANTSRIVAHRGLWPQFIRVVRWFMEHPRSGLYLRQLPIPGIDTKFLERNEAILDSLISVVIPEYTDLTEKRFVARHGLRLEDPQLRLRFLDPALQARCGIPIEDFATPISAFCNLPFGGVHAIITENLRNFLALPSLVGAVGIFGGGHALTLLGSARWLETSNVFYWGDIDAHGLLMLSRLRLLFPRVNSVMMDEETLEVAADLTGTGSPGDFAHLPGLNEAEAKLFDRVRDGDLGLEQERVPFEFVLQKLASEVAPLLSSTSRI